MRALVLVESQFFVLFWYPKLLLVNKKLSLEKGREMALGIKNLLPYLSEAENMVFSALKVG
jgi:hypothetical protein